jgi:hypothetical protein
MKTVPIKNSERGYIEEYHAEISIELNNLKHEFSRKEIDIRKIKEIVTSHNRKVKNFNELMKKLKKNYENPELSPRLLDKAIKLPLFGDERDKIIDEITEGIFEHYPDDMKNDYLKLIGMKYVPKDWNVNYKEIYDKEKKEERIAAIERSYVKKLKDFFEKEEKYFEIAKKDPQKIDNYKGPDPWTMKLKKNYEPPKKKVEKNEEETILIYKPNITKDQIFYQLKLKSNDNDIVYECFTIFNNNTLYNDNISMDQKLSRRICIGVW